MCFRAVVFVVFLGCASSKEGAFSSADDAASTEAADEGDMSFDEAEAIEEPVAWELAGSVVLDAGVIVEDSSLLTVHLLSEQRTVLCEGEATIETATAMGAAQFPQEDELVGWWRLFVEPVGGVGCFKDEYDFPVPVSMLFGIGPMHPEIIAAVGADPELDQVDGLNGVYGSMDDGQTIWVFGVIGTEDAYAGVSGPEEAAPLSDGTWTIEPVYSFPL